MNGIDTNNEVFDEESFDAIRHAYRNVYLRVPLADIQQYQRHTSLQRASTTRLRLVLAAAMAVTLVTVGSWLLLGQSGHEQHTPGTQPRSSAVGTPGKPPRPTSSATTDAGKCADYGQAELDAASGSSQLGRIMPPLRLTLARDQIRLLIYAADDIAMPCWLSGDVVVVQGSPTAVNAERYPAGELSYSSMDSGQGLGGVAFGRVPAGTTKVTILFPTGPDAVATVVGEWFAYFAPPGPNNDRLAMATKVTAVTPTGSLSQQIHHG